MLILQIPPRLIVIHGPPTFPCEATVEADLSPPELFGAAPLSGRLPLGRGGTKVQLKTDSFDGGVRFAVSGRLETIPLDSRFAGMAIRIDGGRLRASWSCVSEQHLRDSIANIELVLPALLAAVVPSPVSIGELTGLVGSAGLTCEFRGTTQRSFYSFPGQALGKDMGNRLALFDAAAAASPDLAVLTSAHRYLAQSRRLGYASNHSTEFVGERLLNLYKAIEILFGRKADSLREDLNKLGVSKDVAEGIFVALLFVRDELDVGHPAVHALDPTDWEHMHGFVERAEDGVTWLLARVLRAVAGGTFKLRAIGNGGSKRKLLQAIAARAHVRVKAYGPGDWKTVEK